MNPPPVKTVGAPARRRAPRFPLRAQVASLLAICAGSAVLIGWQWDNETLTRVLPSAVPMMPLTAFCFVLSGLALALLRHRNGAAEGDSRWRIPLGRIAAAVVGAVAAATLLEYSFNWDLPLDTWIRRDAVLAAGEVFPGRMAGATAVGFLFVSASILALDPRGKWPHGPAHVLALGATMNGLISFEGYLFGVETLYRVVPYSSMAIHTAALFIVMGLGVLFASSDKGLMRVLSSTQLGGAMARRVLPWVVLLPIVLGWIQQRAVAQGWFDEGMGLALLVTATIAVLAAIVWYSARALNAFDAGRDRSQQELRRSAEELRAAQQRVLASEERLRLAVTAGGIGTWHLDLQRNELSWSDTCRELFQVPPQSPMSYEGFIALLHPDDRVPTAGAIRQALDTRSGYEIEHRALLADGSTRWFASKGRAFCDDSGRPARLEGVVIDIDRRKRAEETARATQLSLEAAQVRAQLGSWEHDLVTGRITWSHEMYRLFACAPDQPPPGGEAFLELLHPADRETARQMQHAMLAGMSSGVTELRVNPDRGEERWLQATIDLVRDPAGRPVSAAGTMLDITARRRAEQEIRELNTELEQRVEARTAELAQATSQLSAVLAAATQVSIIATDTAGRVTVFNTGAERMLGYTASEIVGRATPLDLHLPAEIEARGVELTRACGRSVAGFDVLVESARQGRAEEQDWTYVRKDGSQLIVSMVVTAQRDPAGRLIGFLNVARDITRQRATEEHLRVKSAALDAADNGVAITDAKGVISWVNPAFCRLTGYDMSEVLGRPPRVLKSGVHAREFYEQMWQTILDGKVWRGELVNRRKDGSSYFEEMTITPVRGEDGRIGHFIAIKQNITARRKAEDDLRQAKEAAESATQAKSGFLAVMSHEIRTPINGVIGMSNLLLGTELGERQRRYAETIQNSAETLLTIINDILDFSKIEAGKLELETTDCDLHALVGETLELMSPRARAHHVELSGLVEPDVPQLVRGDPVRLRQVLGNLVSNAVKFTKDGEVCLRVSRLQETSSAIDLRFSVRDTGIGIPLEAQPRLFQAFSQADNSTTRRFGGTGLGLAICRQLVELMHGTIGLESQPGAGSTFFFSVPLQKQTSADRPPGLPFALTKPAPRTLIVQAREYSREVLRRLLQAWSAGAETATDAAEALQLLRGEADAGRRFGLVVIDGDLPGAGGFALAATISGDPRLGAPLLVLLEPLGRVGPAESPAGGAALLGKPVRQGQLLACIETLMIAGASGRQRSAPPLPLAEPAVPAPAAVRILLAEDNLVNQQVALEMLARLGHQADVVENGRAAVEAVLGRHYDVVFMDCMMPEMDGYEATMRIREAERLPGRPQGKPVHIVAMTANALVGDREKCLSSGMNDYLAKPIRVGELRQALRRWSETSSTPTTTVNPAVPAAAPKARPAPDSEAPVVDLERLGEVGSHQPQKLRRLISLYSRQAEESVEQLAAAVTSGRADEVARIAHRWGGASAQLGITVVVEVLSELENRARQGDLSRAPADLTSLQRQWQRARQFLEFYQRTL